MDGITEVAKVFVEPAIKLVDTVARGCGIIYEPTRRKRLAAASAFEISTIADAIRENIDLPITYNNNGIQIDSSDVKELAERATKRMLLQEMRKQQNIEAIVDKAYEELKDEVDVSSEPVDEDWIIRFFNCVEDIGNEEMRIIWAKVLAGEVRQPRTYALRTLETLKNISPQEASVFNKVASYSIKLNVRRLLIPDLDLWREFNIRFDDLRLLDECGLLICDSTTIVESNFNNSSIMELETDSLIIRVVNHSSKTSSFRIRCMQFTTAGRELANSLGIESNPESILRFLKTIEYDHSIFHLSAHPIEKSNSGIMTANMGIDLLN